MFTQQTFQEMSMTKNQEADMMRKQVLHLFDRALMAGQARKLIALFGGSRRLQHLSEVQDHVKNRYHVGVQNVPVRQIRGSLGRTDSFDADFNPTQEHTKYRWVNIAAAMKLGEPMPPVELVRVGDTYYVSDGHHRVSAARALKQAYIEAVVTAWEI
jgi:hypothetical protein